MDVSTLVSEAVQEAVQAASQLDLCSATQMEEFSVPPTLPCHDLSQDGGCQQDETAAYANSKCGPEHVAALEVPGQPTASLRLHKAKIRALERELEAARTALEARHSEIKELRQEYFDVKSSRMVTSRTVSGLEQQVTKLLRQLEESRGQVAAKDTMLRQYRDENSAGEREKRRADAESKAQNARLNRALDEVQRFRKQLEDVKHQTAAQDSVTQTEYQRVMADNKRLERQKSELLAAFKKQGRLINILKKQRIHIETARLLQFTEEEFVAVIQ